MSSPEAQCWFLGLSVIKNYSCTCRGSQAWCCRFMPVLLVTPVSSMCCSVLIGILNIRQQFPLRAWERLTRSICSSVTEDCSTFFLCPQIHNPISFQKERWIFAFFSGGCVIREKGVELNPDLFFFPPKASVLPFPRWTNSAKQRSVLQCLYPGLLDFKTLITRENVTPAWGIFPKEQEGCPETRGKSYFIWS